MTDTPSERAQQANTLLELAAIWKRERLSLQTHQLSDAVRHADSAIQSLEAGAAALLREQAQTWLPIETAPKDGTPVLSFEEGAISIVSWVPADGSDPEGWYDVGRLDPPPTHWMPLPPDPPAPSPERPEIP